MSALHFLTLDEALAIHEVVIGRFGGSSGVRDLGLLESALYRPRSGYYVDLVQMASALFESLLLNHAFVDGNKRVAFFATDVFLRMNGWKISASAEQAYDFIVGGLERGTLRREEIEAWLRGTVVELD